MPTTQPNSVPDPKGQIKDWHAFWNKLTGQQLPLRMCDYEREHGWHEFIQSGSTKDDLAQVVRYLQREIQEGNRQPAALRWSNVVGNLCRFAEEQELARAEARKKKPTAKDKVLEQARPVVAKIKPSDAKVTSRPVSEVIKAMRKAAE